MLPNCNLMLFVTHPITAQGHDGDVKDSDPLGLNEGAVSVKSTLTVKLRAEAL